MEIALTAAQQAGNVTNTHYFNPIVITLQILFQCYCKIPYSPTYYAVYQIGLIPFAITQRISLFSLAADSNV